MNDTVNEEGRLPVPLKVFGVLSIVGGLASLGDLAPVIFSFVQGVGGGTYRTASIVIFAGLMAVLTSSAVLFVFLGVRLLRNRRAHAAQAANTLAALTVLAVIGTLMLFGLSAHHIGYLVQIVILVAVTSYLDPQLHEERRLQRKLKKMDKEQRSEERRLARERKPKKGFITLNFFNLFWIFVVASVLGLLMEEIVHFLFVVPGQWQDRAGLLFGPFSPIYGCGAVLMTIFLNRFHKSNWLVIFLVAAVIGGAFEAFVSLFMQYAFGAVAWDYSNMPGSLFGGRTCLPFMACWGLLGVVWIKLLLPFMLRLVNFIPWNWRYMLTTVAACFMLVDAVMTLQALDCWYMRLSHDPIDTPIQQFYDHEFGDTYMADRFQSMTIVPSDAVRG